MHSSGNTFRCAVRGTISDSSGSLPSISRRGPSDGRLRESSGIIQRLPAKGASGLKHGFFDLRRSGESRSRNLHDRSRLSAASGGHRYYAFFPSNGFVEQWNAIAHRIARETHQTTRRPGVLLFASGVRPIFYFLRTCLPIHEEENQAPYPANTAWPPCEPFCFLRFAFADTTTRSGSYADSILVIRRLVLPSLRFPLRGEAFAFGFFFIRQGRL